MLELKAAARRLARETDDRVRVKFVEQHDLDDGPVSCDGALFTGPVLAGYSPSSRLFSLPLLFRSTREVVAIRARMQETVAEELEARELVVLAQLDLGFAYLHSVRPIESVAALKTVRLWAPPASPESIQEAEGYGVTLRVMDAGRVRDALRQGELDAVLVPPLGAIVLQWGPELKVVAEPPFLCVEAVLGVRKESLSGMTPADQTLLRQELTAALTQLAEELHQKEQEALEVLEKNGLARRPLWKTASQQEEWRRWADEVADRMSEEGWLPAGVLDRTRSALTELRAASAGKEALTGRERDD